MFNPLTPRKLAIVLAMDYGLILTFALYILVIKGIGNEKISSRSAALILAIGVLGFSAMIQIILGQLYLLPPWYWFTFNQIVSFLIIFGILWFIFHHLDEKSDDHILVLILGTVGFVATFYLPMIVPILLHNIGIN